MKNKNRLNKFRILYWFLVVWWTIAIMIAFLQGYFMSQNVIFILLIIATPFVGWFVVRLLYKQLIKRNVWALWGCYVLGAVHFVPLILQFVGVREPGIDAVITGVIGLGILEICGSDI